MVTAAWAALVYHAITAAASFVEIGIATLGGAEA